MINLFKVSNLVEFNEIFFTSVSVLLIHIKIMVFVTNKNKIVEMNEILMEMQPISSTELNVQKDFDLKNR